MAQGVVQKISTKPWEGKDGQVILYSFQLGGDRAWYRTGTKNPGAFGIAEGKSVKFEVDYKGNVVANTVQVLADGTVQRAPAVASNTSAPSSSRDSYWEAKETRDKEKDERYQTVDIPRMTYCGAQEVAVKVVELALANGGITLPAKKGAVLDAIIGAVDAVTVSLAKSRMAAPELLANDGPDAPAADTSDPDDY